MANRGWLTLHESVDELEAEVVGCVGVPVLPEPPRLAVRWRGSSARPALTYAQLAWLRRAETLAHDQTGIGPWRDDHLEPLARELSSHMRLVEDVTLVPATLARWGVRFVLLRHLPKTYLDGAAFWLAEGPAVALTLRYDRIDAFWFTLDARTGPPGRGPQRGVPGSVGGWRRGRARTVARRLLRGCRKSPGERVVAGAGGVRRFRNTHGPALLPRQHRGVCCQPGPPPRHRARPLAARGDRALSQPARAVGQGVAGAGGVDERVGG